MPIREKYGPRFLMDQEEGNLGSEQRVTAKPFGQEGQGFPSRILNFNGDSKYGKSLTIGMSAFWERGGPYALSQVLASPGFGGPVVATVEFGNGGVFTTVEVDIPIGGSVLPSISPARAPDRQNAVLITIPASNVRVIPRNDGGLVPVDYSGNPTCFMRLDGLNDTPDIQRNSTPATCLVKAFLVEGPRASFRQPSRLLPLFVNYNGAAPVPVGPVYFMVPSFAKTVRFLREGNFALTYSFGSSAFYGAVLDSGAIAAGVTSPIIEVPTQATWFTCTLGGLGTWADFGLEI